jgi:hypothetical protein
MEKFHISPPFLCQSGLPPRLLFLLAKEEKEAKRRITKDFNDTANLREKSVWFGHSPFYREGICRSAYSYSICPDWQIMSRPSANKRKGPEPFLLLRAFVRSPGLKDKGSGIFTAAPFPRVTGR